jgi:hypothetical protein
VEESQVGGAEDAADHRVRCALTAARGRAHQQRPQSSGVLDVADPAVRNRADVAAGRGEEGGQHRDGVRFGIRVYLSHDLAGQTV